MAKRRSKAVPPPSSRPKRNWLYKLPLTIPQILAWADAHHQLTGTWPNADSGSVHELPDQTWGGVDWALKKGYRGLPGGSSLSRLLAEHRGVKKQRFQPPLTLKQILRWADAHHKRTGQWPTAASGPVHEAADEDWGRIDRALQVGLRGLSGGSTLRRFFIEQRGFRPNLTIDQILAWANAHQKRTGRRPMVYSGAVHGVDGETWEAINRALTRGNRGLPGGHSLATLLDEQRGPRPNSPRRPTAARRAVRLRVP